MAINFEKISENLLVVLTYISMIGCTLRNDYNFFIGMFGFLGWNTRHEHKIKIRILVRYHSLKKSSIPRFSIQEINRIAPASDHCIVDHRHRLHFCENHKFDQLLQQWWLVQILVCQFCHNHPYYHWNYSQSSDLLLLNELEEG